MEERILKLINSYWKFDSDQSPASSYHDKQDLLMAIEKEFATEKTLGVKHICSCCRGNRKTAGGFIWKYK